MRIPPFIFLMINTAIAGINMEKATTTVPTDDDRLIPSSANIPQIIHANKKANIR
ncbi:MAG: hypothetical protein FWC47_01365 [Oscillospiraceae bacterium]|nr:hypothetical protein [Oscillospiraceae bacterium]